MYQDLVKLKYDGVNSGYIGNGLSTVRWGRGSGGEWENLYDPSVLLTTQFDFSHPTQFSLERP